MKMSISPEDITLMICGPLHQCGLENIPYYLSKSVKVIYSTWRPKDRYEKYLLQKVRKMLPSERIIISDHVDVSNRENTQNIYYQAWTWSNAAIICDTTYCIKSRSNCKYDNIDPLIEAIIANPDKIVSISAFFHSYNQNSPYCPSDFVISMKKDEAMKVTEALLDSLSQKREFYSPPEQKICYTTLIHRKIYANLSDIEIIRKQMRDVYFIVNVNDLKPTLYWHKMGPFNYFDHEKEKCIYDITNY